MKNQTFSAQQVSRRLALGAVTLALVVLAADRSGATPTARHEQRFDAQQSNAQRGQATSSRADQKPSQPRVPWWKDPVVVKEIGLTPDQGNRIDAIWKKREADMHGVATEHRIQKDELDRLVTERKVGPDVIGLQVDRVEAQRTTLNKSWTVMIYRFSLILTPEQNKALQAHFDRNRRDRR